MENFSEHKIGNLLNSFFASIEQSDEGKVIPFVLSWEKLVGVDIASHSRVLDIHNGVIVIGFDHPAWLQQMSFSSKKILKKIKKQFPALKIKNVHLKIIEKI